MRSQMVALLLSVGAHAAAGAALLPGLLATEQRAANAPITIHFVAFDASATVGEKPAASASAPVPMAAAAPNSVAPKAKPRRLAPLSVRPAAPDAVLVAAAAPVAAKSAPEAPVTAGGIGVPGTAPRLIRNTVREPTYTSDARRVGYRGFLIVDIVVDASGRVAAAQLRNPTGLALDSEVLNAARNAIYHPALDVDGRPLRAPAELKFQFTR